MMNCEGHKPLAVMIRTIQNEDGAERRGASLLFASIHTSVWCKCSVERKARFDRISFARYPLGTRHKKICLQIFCKYGRVFDKGIPRKKRKGE